jgi:uncharacterized membrane protein YGL010W
MKKIDALLSEYGESHQNGLNKTIHWICVPLIFFSIIGLIWSIPAEVLKNLVPAFGAYANWATLLLILTLIYYLSLSAPLFLGMIVVVTGFSMLANWVDSSVSAPLWMVSAVIFVLAWIGQFYGHKVEGKKPSFFKDLQFLLIGPAWLMHFIYKKLGIPY